MNSQLIYLLQTSVQEIQANKLSSAKSLLAKALKINDAHPDTLRFLGVIAALEKDWDEALRLIDLALKADPKNSIAYSNRGNILKELKRYEEALSCYGQCIALNANYAEAYSNKGNVLQSMGRHEEALQSYEQAIAIDNHFDQAYSNKGNALQRLGRLDEALQCYERSIMINPKNALALYEAAHIFNLRKQYEFSLACSERALQINSEYVEAWLENGLAYFQVKEYEKAIASYETALNIDQQCLAAWLSKGDIYNEMKEFKLAQLCFKRAHEIDPSVDFLYGLYVQTTLQMCDWDNWSDHTKRLMEHIERGQKAAIPYNIISLLDKPLLIKKAVEIYAGAILGGAKRRAVPANQIGKKIRLAYFSADFHNHPTAHLIAELFEKQDKSQFELIAFVFGRDQPDAMRARLVKAFDHFIDVDNRTDEEIAELSREMGVDIAIDLKGFTQYARPQIFVHGAAPIQISYLGFPGTMGTTCFDYVIADKVLVPENQQEGFVEKIIYMPNSYQINDRQREISPSKKVREDWGLPKTGFIFCCFNNNYKITPTVFDGWVRILKAVEESVLWLFGDNLFAIENLKKEAVVRGLNPDRLIFAGRVESSDHLARYQLADLFLDTAPCNAHTTASDALWAGLPVLTLLGNSFGARVASSLLSAVGLPDLITSTQDEYETLAIQLATQPAKLIEIKERLEVNRFTTPLFDTPLFTQHLEAAYIAAYQRHQLGLPPEHIDVKT